MLTEQILNHPRNENISFDKDAHTYHYTEDGETTQFYGVTSLIKQYASEFDEDGIAFAVARREGTTPEKIKAQWREKGQRAIEYGNWVHDMIEYYNNDQITPEDDTGTFDAYLEAIDSFGLEPICSEWVIYDERIQRASAIDGVYQCDGKLVLVDYKTNEDLDKIFKVFKDKRFFYPISELPESKYFKYTLQLNIYHKILTDLYDVPLKDEMFILHLREGEYEWIPVLKMRETVDKLYEEELALSS